MSFSLRFTIPFSLLIFTLLLSGWSLEIDREIVSQRIEKNNQEILTRQLSRTQSLFEHLIKIGDLELIQDDLAALGSDYHILQAVLLNEKNIILASLRVDEIGRSFAQAKPAPDVATLSNTILRMNSIRDNLQGEVRIGHNNKNLVGIFPIQLPIHIHELRAGRIGILYVRQDLSTLKAEALLDRRRNALTFLIGMCGLIIGLYFFIYYGVTKRIARLAQTTREFALGRLKARANVAGKDEIAGLARSLEDMARARLKSIEEREVLIKELEIKNTELERFTYTVSHDLKSPLITIKGFLELLEQDALSGNIDRLKNDIKRIDSAADKMKRLLDELLELSRIGRRLNPVSEISPTELIRETLELLEGTIRKQGIRVIVEDDLPSFSGDRPRIQEVYQNLIENACKYMGEQKEPLIKIGARLIADGENEHNEYYVEDNGMGIEPDYLQKIFEIFEKLDPNSEGSGIGLALVKRIIEVHGGQIKAESGGPGLGSTFTFTLPTTERI